MPPDGKLGGKERPTDEIRPSAGRVHNSRTRGILAKRTAAVPIPGADHREHRLPRRDRRRPRAAAAAARTGGNTDNGGGQPCRIGINPGGGVRGSHALSRRSHRDLHSGKTHEAPDRRRRGSWQGARQGQGHKPNSRPGSRTQRDRWPSSSMTTRKTAGSRGHPRQRAARQALRGPTGMAQISRRNDPLSSLADQGRTCSRSVHSRPQKPGRAFRVSKPPATTPEAGKTAYEAVPSVPAAPSATPARRNPTARPIVVYQQAMLTRPLLGGFAGLADGRVKVGAQGPVAGVCRQPLVPGQQLAAQPVRLAEVPHRNLRCKVPRACPREGGGWRLDRAGQGAGHPPVRNTSACRRCSRRPPRRTQLRIIILSPVIVRPGAPPSSE